MRQVSHVQSIQSTFNMPERDLTEGNVLFSAQPDTKFTRFQMLALAVPPVLGILGLSISVVVGTSVEDGRSMFIPSMFLVGLGSAIGFVVGLVHLIDKITEFFRLKNTIYVGKDSYLKVNRDWINTVSREISLAKTNSVKTYQSFFQRFFNVLNITISTSDGEKFVLINIKESEMVHDKISSLVKSVSSKSKTN